MAEEKQGMRITEFATDSKKETDGVWVSLGKGAEIKIARAGAGNTKYRAEMRRLSKPFTQQLRRGSMDLDALEDISIQALAKCVLLDWKNLQDADGNNVPHSIEQAEKYLREMPEFLEIVADCARDADLFRCEDEEQARKNS